MAKAELREREELNEIIKDFNRTKENKRKEREEVNELIKEDRKRRKRK